MFYDRYADLCRKKGVSESKAAESIGLNRATVVRWRKGSTPNAETLNRLAAYFEVSVDFLINEAEDLQQNFVFFDNFEKLCHEKKISTYKVATSIGLNRSIIARWKKGATPNGRILNELSSYFDVSVDYLLGKSDIKKSPESDRGFSKLYSNLILLAARRQTLVTNLCEEITGGREALEDWKRGEFEQEHIEAISKKFDIPVEFLLDDNADIIAEDNKRQKAKMDTKIKELRERNKQKAVIMDFGGNGQEIIEIPDELRESFKSMIDAFNRKDKN